MEVLHKFRSSIQNKTAKDVIGDNFVLRDIGAENSVLQALEKLQKYNVSSLPVYYEHTKKYFGSISFQDLAVVIYVLAVSKSFVDLFAEELVEWKDFDNEEFKVFANEKVEEFVNASERNQWSVVKTSTPILEVMKILSNPAQSEEKKGKDNIRRLGVEDEKGQMVGVISQYGLMEFLIKEMKSSNLFNDLKFIEVVPKYDMKIFTVKETDLAYEGFRIMLEHKISGVGVVNDKEQLVSVFSSHDLKRDSIEHNLFADLRLSVKDYLSKSKRFFDKEISTKDIVLHKDDSFMQLIDKIQKYHLHHIFSVDENLFPTGVISLCDIISSLLID